MKWLKKFESIQESNYKIVDEQTFRQKLKLKKAIFTSDELVKMVETIKDNYQINTVYCSRTSLHDVHGEVSQIVDYFSNVDDNFKDEDVEDDGSDMWDNFNHTEKYDSFEMVNQTPDGRYMRYLLIITKLEDDWFLVELKQTDKKQAFKKIFAVCDEFIGLLQCLSNLKLYIST